MVFKKGRLPEGWIKTKIQNLVLNSKVDIVDGPFGSNLKAIEYVKDGIPLIRLQNVGRNQFVNKNIKYITKEKAESLRRHNFQRNDIVITKLGKPLGVSCLVPDYLSSGIIVADIIRVRVSHDLISRKFLIYAINSDELVTQFEKYTKGTTRPRVNLTKFRDFQISIPPFTEQKRIVTKIESIFAQIDAAKEILLRLQGNMQSKHTSLASLKSSVLKQAFEGRLVPQDPDGESAEDFLHKIHKNSKKELIFEEDNMPRRWVKTSLDSVSHIILGQSPPSSTYNSLKDGLPFFQGKTDFGVLHPKTRVWCSSPKKIAEKNDLLLSVRAPVGSTNLSKERCCIGRGLAAIRSINCDMPIMFFVYFFRHIENYLENQGTGTTFKAISGKQIRDLRIPLPPLNEQKRIVAKIESIFGNIDTLNLFYFILLGNLFTNLRYFIILYMPHAISDQ